MAQFDLLLTQNVSGAGTEFSEKYVNIAKGGILSAITDGTPTVLAGGTDGYMLVRDDGEDTGLKWVVISAGHTQNTDTGTTGNTFTIDSDSSTGKMVLDVDVTGNGDHSLTLTNAAIDDSSKTITFPNTTGTVALTSDLGTMASEAATDYVAKALFDATTVLFATSDNTPAALLGTELPPKLWAEVPADTIGTGWTGTAIAGQIARDDNWLYICKTGGTATNQAWLRSALATNWT